MTATEPTPAPGRAAAAFLGTADDDDLFQAYECAPCGLVTTTTDGVIISANAAFRTWVDRESAELVGRTAFADLLSPGGRIYHETHVAPMLHMHGQVEEVALELARPDGTRLPVLVSATVSGDETGDPRTVRMAVFGAAERRRYERELLDAKQQAEASEHRAQALARTLQQTLIPPAAPTIPGLEVAAVYHPAGTGAEVGGDFYDVFSLVDGDWVVTLGDVCGKGYDAAVVTALVRYTVRALAVTHGRPSEILLGVNEVLANDSTDRFCTLVVLRLHRDADGWQVLVGTGGHPAPLLVVSGRAPEECAGEGPLLGVFDDPTYADRTLRLAPGQTLVLYTDGVVEGRRERELFGELRLDHSLRSHGADPHTLVPALLADVLAFQRGVARDDVAIVALGVPASAG